MYNSSQDLLVQCKSALFALKVFSVFYPVNLALKLFNNTMQLNFAPDCIHCLCFFKLNDIIFYSCFCEILRAAIQQYVNAMCSYLREDL